MWNLKKKKNGTNEFIYKAQTETQIQKTSSWLLRREERGIDWETWTDTHTAPFIRQIMSKDLLHGLGNSPQYTGITKMGKDPKKRLDT